MAIIAAGTWWTFALLGRSTWSPWLRWVVLLAGVLAILIVLLPRGILARPSLLAAPLIAVTLLLGPTAYSLQTAATAHTGAIPTAGPTSGGFGNVRFGAGRGPGQIGAPQLGNGMPFGGFPRGQNSQQFGRGGAPGGLRGAGAVSSELITLLRNGASRYEWVAATTGDNEAASLELATHKAVMSLGGYNGTDPAISLTKFKELVAKGKVHYYVADSQGFIGSGNAQESMAYQIQQWVESTFTSTTSGGTTIYDLTSTKSG